jgi:hypothetical protein
MSCRNLKSEFSAENYETLETLGPKIQNSRNCNLIVVGGVLREVIHPYAIFSHNVSVLSVGTPKKARVIQISGNPRRVVRFCRKNDGFLCRLVQWLLQDLCFDIMLSFDMLGSSMRFISILAFT